VDVIQTGNCDDYISDQCLSASSRRSTSSWTLGFFLLFLLLVFRLPSIDLIRVASLPRGAGLATVTGSSWIFCFISSSLCLLDGGIVPSQEGTSRVLSLRGVAGVDRLTGVDSSTGCDLRASLADTSMPGLSISGTVFFGSFEGSIMSHFGSLGLDGAEQEDMGRSKADFESHVSSMLLGDHAGVDGAESICVVADVADIGGVRRPANDEVADLEWSFKAGGAIVEKR
jgi:hypothetical protein